MLSWAIIGIGFVIAIAGVILVELTRKSAEVVVYDTFNNEKRKKARVKDGKVIFAYNGQSKAGVPFENNETRRGKVRVFHYDDIDGTLLPVEKIRYQQGSQIKAALNLSTSQEKMYEGDSLKAIAKKIDETWWEKNKHLVMPTVFVLAAMILSIYMVQSAFNLEQPAIEAFNEMTETLKEVSEQNLEMKEQMQDSDSKEVPQ